jgi:plastocyanin
VGSRNIMKSAVFVIVVFVFLVAIGTLLSSGPSDAAVAADKRPATTTTTEAPPEGLTVVRIDNGVFRPANLKIDINEIWVVRWVNDDKVEYLLEGTNDEFQVQLPPGESFEFDFSGLEPGIYRYRAFVGFNRIPGSVDTRPQQ